MSGPIKLDPIDAGVVLGAIDTLGVLLAGYDHEWSEGERAIYERATELLGAPKQPPEPAA